MLKLSSVTLLRALEHYGDPKSLAADLDAAEQLSCWGGVFLAPEKAERLVEERRVEDVGVLVGEQQRARSKSTPVSCRSYRQQIKGAGTTAARTGRRE